MPPITVRNAVSAASRPVAMRTSDERGASSVASTTRQVPSTSASATAWKSIGCRPGRVDGGDARRDVAGAEQRHDEMGEVAADTAAAEQRVDRAVGRQAAARLVAELASDPRRDGRRECPPAPVRPPNCRRPTSASRSDSA